VNGVQHAIFARHVMRFRCYRTERRTPQNIFTAIRSNQIDQIRMAVRELFNLDSAGAFRQVLTEIVR